MSSNFSVERLTDALRTIIWVFAAAALGIRPAGNDGRGLVGISSAGVAERSQGAVNLPGPPAPALRSLRLEGARDRRAAADRPVHVNGGLNSQRSHDTADATTPMAAAVASTQRGGISSVAH